MDEFTKQPDDLAWDLARVFAYTPKEDGIHVVIM